MSKSKIALSLVDLLRGIGKTEEKLIEKIPEAAKVPVAKRKQTEGMSTKEMIDFWNKEGLLGQFRSGAPAVADLVEPTVDRFGREEFTRSGLPRAGEIRFMEADQLNKPVRDRITAGRFAIEQDKEIENALSMYPSIELLLNEARKSPNFMQQMFGKEPVTRHLTTTMAPPDVGGTGYQLAYDLIRNAGDVNVADILTSRNAIRRPLNVANYGLARGDYRNVLPLSDKGIGSASEQMGQRIYGSSESPSALEYLTEALGDEGLAREALGFGPERLAVLASRDPQVASGYLGLLNAMRAATVGPDAYKFYRTGLHPADTPAIARTIDKSNILRNVGDKAGNVEGAFGPGALGRARTVESALHGSRLGMKPEEIVEEITKNVDPSGYFGRYAKGGLAAALT